MRGCRAGRHRDCRRTVAIVFCRWWHSPVPRITAVARVLLERAAARRGTSGPIILCCTSAVAA